MIDQYIFQPSLQGSARVDHLIDKICPILKEYHNGRLIAELALHAADESFKTAVARCEQGRPMLSEEEFIVLGMLMLKIGEMTFASNFNLMKKESI